MWVQPPCFLLPEALLFAPCCKIVSTCQKASLIEGKVDGTVCSLLYGPHQPVQPSSVLSQTTPLPLLTPQVTLLVVYNSSYSVALYGLLMFYKACGPLLAPFRPLQKFFAVKSIIFATYWQSVVVHFIPGVRERPRSRGRERCAALA